MGRIMTVLCLIGVVAAGYVAYRYGVFWGFRKRKVTERLKVGATQ